MWLIFPVKKREMAATLSRMYRGGVGVLTWSQHLIAFVDPRGNITELPPPHKRYEMWQIANQPRPDECPCLDYFDPEMQGPWRVRGPDFGHHPLCQFDRTSQKVFLEAGRQAIERTGYQWSDRKIEKDGQMVPEGWIRTKKGPAQERPDEWMKIREEMQ